MPGLWFCCWVFHCVLSCMGSLVPSSWVPSMELGATEGTVLCYPLVWIHHHGEMQELLVLQ